MPGEAKSLIHKPDLAELEEATDGASLGVGVHADPLLGLVVELWGGHSLGDGNLDLHRRAIF